MIPPYDVLTPAGMSSGSLFGAQAVAFIHVAKSVQQTICLARRCMSNAAAAMQHRACAAWQCMSNAAVQTDQLYTQHSGKWLTC